MKSKFNCVWLILLFLITSLGCGQSEIVLPSFNENGFCGSWYPEGDKENAEVYAFKNNQTLPCAVFESVSLNGENTYLNLGGIYLDVVHRKSDARHLVFVISADRCPSCSVLIHKLAAAADEIENAKTIMINITFCDNINRTDCDFTIERAVTAAQGEGWPINRWYVTNDAEDNLRSMYRDSFPTVIVARISDMKVVSVDRSPNAEDLIEMLSSF